MCMISESIDDMDAVLSKSGEAMTTKCSASTETKQVVMSSPTTQDTAKRTVFRLCSTVSTASNTTANDETDMSLSFDIDSSAAMSTPSTSQIRTVDVMNLSTNSTRTKRMLHLSTACNALPLKKKRLD